MSKIVILKASPRKNGNSNTLAAAFAEEVQRTGAFITEYDRKLQVQIEHF